MYKHLSVSIVLPNWNGKHLLEKNLPKVVAASANAEIVVADDASSDGSVEFLARTFPEIKVVANTKQQGFSGNVNSGVARATGDIVVLLNTDVVPEKGYLNPLLERFADPSVGAVGALEKSHERNGIILRGRGVARWEKGYFIHSRGEVDREDTAWVSGGSSAYRRSLWMKLGGMDTRFNPFYWEDIDLSYRIQRAGFRTLFEKKSVVHHYHEEGKIRSTYTKDDVRRIVYRNQFIFLWKNIPNGRIWLEHIFWTPVRLVQALISGDTLMLQGLMLAIVRFPFV